MSTREEPLRNSFMMSSRSFWSRSACHGCTPGRPVRRAAPLPPPPAGAAAAAARAGPSARVGACPGVRKPERPAARAQQLPELLLAQQLPELLLLLLHQLRAPSH